MTTIANTITKEIEYTCSYNGGFYLTTDLNLNGRGVKLSGDFISCTIKENIPFNGSSDEKIKSKLFCLLYAQIL